MHSDPEASAGAAPTSSDLDAENGLTAINGFNANNGLNVSNGLNANNGLNTSNGLGMINGFNTNNGFNSNNGFNTNNGFNSNNGLNVTNGLNIANGLNTSNGLYSNTGLMTTDAGRKVVKYIAKCALASNDSLVKQDQNGVSYTFPGSIGLAPGYKTAGCGKDCSESMSACLMAHVNTSGIHIPLWMTSPDTPVGWGTSPWFPLREGTFFGQIMVTNAAYNLDGYYCNGPGIDANVVPGRLGSTQGNVPYANAYPVTGKDCDSHCSMRSDGAISCPANGVTWTHPITVFRGYTYEAENAEAGAFDHNTGTIWTPSGAIPACGSGVCSQAVPVAGHGHKVQGFQPNHGVRFLNVPIAIGGSNNLVVYYSSGASRNFQFIVNGGTPQVRAFPTTAGGYDGAPESMIVNLAGFNAGTNNWISVTADASGFAPHLDWIEIINSTDASAGTTATTATTDTTNTASSAAAVVRYEAEDATLVTDTTPTAATASAGSYVHGRGGGSVKWTVNSVGGTQTLTFAVKTSTSGTDSMGIFINGSSTKAGVISSTNYTSTFEIKTLSVTLNAGSNTIEMRDSEGTNEADVDYVELK